MDGVSLTGGALKPRLSKALLDISSLMAGVKSGALVQVCLHNYTFFAKQTAPWATCILPPIGRSYAINRIILACIAGLDARALRGWHSGLELPGVVQ